MIKEKHILTNPYNHHALSRYIDVYEVSANRCHSVPESGYKGTEATLVDESAWNEKFSSYSITGATLTGNNFIIDNDVTAQANYETAKNLTLQTDGHGTIAANKNSGFIGDQVTLSNTAATNYSFSGYTITGATLTGNKFNFVGNDVTAKVHYTYVGPVSISLISNTTATAYCEATYNGETTAWTSNGTITKDIPMGATVVFSAVVPKYYRVQNMVNTGIDNFITARGTGSDTNQRIISGTGVITGAGSISTNNTHLNKVYLTGSWSTTTANRQTWFANSGGASRLKACPTITTFKQAASLPSAESVKGTINANINLYGTTAKNRTMAWRDYTTANNLLDLRGASAVRNSGHLNITGYAYHHYDGWTANPSQRGLYCRGVTAGSNSNAILIDGGFFVGGSRWSAASTKTASYDYNYTGNGDFTGSTEAFYNGCLGVEVYAALTEGGGNVSQTGSCLKYPVNQVYNINGSFIWSGILP